MNKLFLSLVTVALLIASWTTVVQSQSSELEEWLLSIEREELGGREMNEVIRERDEFGATGGPTGTGGSTTDDGGDGDTPCTENLDCVSSQECVFAYCDDGTATCAHEVTPTSATCACVSETDNCTDPSQSPFEVDQVLTAGSEGLIVISAKDRNGNPKLTGGLSFTALFDCVSNCGKKSVSIMDVGTSEDQQNGTYIIRFTPYRATSFDLHIRIDTFDVMGSPQTVTVGAGPVSSTKSFVSEVPIYPIATTQNHTFMVILRDEYSNNVLDSPEAIVVDVNGPGDIKGTATVVSYSNGTYSVELTAPQAGVYNITVQTGGKEITNSPFSVSWVLPTATAAQNTFAVGSGVENGTAGARRSITIFAKDQNNASRTAGGDDFVATLNWGTDSVRELTVTDRSDGTYTISYNVTEATTYTLTILYNGNHIRESPYTFSIQPAAAHAASCTITAISGGVVETQRNFNVTAFDIWGNQITDGSASVVIDITHPIGASAVLRNMTTVDVVPGEEYEVYWTAYAVGTYSIAVFIEGGNLPGSPFSVTLTPLPAPVPLSSIIEKNGVRMNIAFDVSTNQAGMIDFQSCDAVLNVVATPFLGDGATCGWISDQTLQVKFGASATILPSDQVTFKTDAIRTVHSNSFAVTDKVSVSIDAPMPDPVAIISGPKLIGVCDPLTLSGLQSTGGLGRAMTIQWTSSLDLNETIALNSSVLDIPSDAIDTPSFTVSLTVTNWLGSTNTATMTINKADVPLPLILVQNSDPVTMVRSDILTLQGSAAFSSCATDKVLNFQWEALSGPDFNDTGILFNQRELKLPKSTLPVGTYLFKFTGAQASNTSLQSSATITVVVEPSAPTARIAGGSRVAGTIQPIVLDAATSSKDNDMAGDLTFDWTCWDNMLNATCQVALPSEGVLTFAAGVLTPGLYSFTVTATSIAGLTATDSVDISIVFGDPPAVSVAPGYGIKASSSNRVSLLGTATSATNSTLSQKWTSIPASAFEITSETSASADIDTGANLVLQPGVLVPGKEYTFRLTATEEGNAPGYAQHTFLVNSAPGSGVITADKLTGSSYTDTFVFTSTGWADDLEDFPLEYQFSYISKDAKKKATRLGQESFIGTRTLNPTAATFFSPGDYTVFVKAYDKHGAFATTSIDISVADVPIPDPFPFFASLLSGSVSDALAAGDFGAALSQVVTIVRAMDEATALTAESRSTLVDMILDVVCPANPTASDPTTAAMSSNTLAVADPTGLKADRVSVCTDNIMSHLQLPENTVMDGNAANDFAQVVGGLFGSGAGRKKRTAVADVVSSVNQLHTLQTSNRFCGELGTTASGDVFELFSQLATTSQVTTSSGLFTFTSGALNFDSAVAIPSSDCYNLQMYSVPTDMTPDNTTLLSRVLIATLTPALSETQEGNPVTVQLPVTSTFDSDTELLKCVRRNDWNEAWTTEGCSTVSYNTSYVVCSCSGLGQFSATKAAKPNSSTTGEQTSTTGSTSEASSESSSLVSVAAVVVPVVVVGAAAVGVVAFIIVKRKRGTKVERIEEGSGRPWNE